MHINYLKVKERLIAWMTQTGSCGLVKRIIIQMLTCFYDVYYALYNVRSCEVTLMKALTMVQVTNLNLRRNLIEVFWFIIKLASLTVINWHPYVNISELCSAVGVETTLRAERRAVRISGGGQTTLPFSLTSRPDLRSTQAAIQRVHGFPRRTAARAWCWLLTSI